MSGHDRPWAARACVAVLFAFDVIAIGWKALS